MPYQFKILKNKQNIVCTIAVVLFNYCILYADIDSNKETNARWYINYGHYLIETGKYLDALDYYETAYGLTSYSKTIIDVLMAKANLLSIYLDSPNQALKIYQEIETRYPQMGDIVIYKQGLVLYEIRQFEKAQNIFNKYLRDYPSGQFKYQSEALLEIIKKQTVPVPTYIIKQPDLRIRLCKKVKKITVVSVSGEKICSHSYGCKSNFMITAVNQGLLINGDHFDINDIHLTCNKPLKIISGKYQKQVRGKLKISLRNNRLSAINIINIEDYLKSVVPSEVYATWPMETLKAQAVAARTYALYQIQHRKSWSFDMVDNEGDQCYGGVKKENIRSTRAVKETEGMVITHNKKAILAMYCANSGGFTADAKAVFNLYNKPYLIAKEDPYSLYGEMAYWNRKYTGIQIEKALIKIGIYCNGIKNIRASLFGPSGRVIKVKIFHNNGSNIMRTKATLARALKLPDILFKIQKIGNQYYFQGKGYGHGVGFSQWGAKFMGDDNLIFTKIINMYYPETMIIKNW